MGGELALSTLLTLTTLSGSHQQELTLTRAMTRLLLSTHMCGNDGSIICQSLVYPEAKERASLTLVYECKLDHLAISRCLVTPGRTALKFLLLYIAEELQQCATQLLPGMQMYAVVCSCKQPSSKPSSPGLLNDSMGVVKVSITHSWRS